MKQASIATFGFTRGGLRTKHHKAVVFDGRDIIDSCPHIHYSYDEANLCRGRLQDRWVGIEAVSRNPRSGKES